MELTDVKLDFEPLENESVHEFRLNAGLIKHDLLSQEISKLLKLISSHEEQNFA